MTTVTGSTSRTTIRQQAGTSLWSRIDRTDLARTLFVAACTAALALGLDWPSPTVPLLAVIGLVVGCWPVVVEAWHDIRQRRMSMELSMLLAIIAAGVIGEWTTSLLITTFVLAAEILEDLSMDRGRDALTALMSFLPTTVTLREGHTTRDIALDDVAPGQVLVIGPGERVPVDGVVDKGRSTLDQSRITGESMPVDVAVGDPVYAGSINQVGALEVRAERVGANSSYGRIVTAVREAQSSRAPVQRMADRFAAWLVYLSIAGAIVTFLVTRDLSATISVIIVAGACGIAAGTPLAVLAAIARIARVGAFVKGGAHLEALSVVDTVVFDKTGTLTRGVPTVTDVRTAPGVSTQQLLAWAGAAEAYSEHPLGRAIAAHVRAAGVAPGTAQSFDYQPGRGVSVEVDGRMIAAGNARLVPDAPASAADGVATPVHVSVDGHYAGTVLLVDQVRDSARSVVAELRHRGLRVMMITGDQPATARAVADELGITEVRAGLLPDEKLRAIDAERAAGHRLAMVGDGVNDAPALMRATVGIAMGSGTDIARDSADVVLISSDLNDLAATLHIARRARRIVMFNFVGTIVVDVIGMVLAAFGLLGPVLAAVFHVGSESAFILNSARLIPGRRH
ncbi:heavy metal translocating P-type ATPase [Propionibacterium freudenreichii]|uniref:heavy metal translocating P-type ATPase n=1 Tax=Propionibacterium freudenreichii TaxID=1744 RepID=UPI0005425CB7|nr:cation-translocating P-type ATPase [Propionibacterium freudenreichii]AJQ90184.1 Putative cation-transporting P-type ATPase [Propionibacterium freudenreichii subsp. freudenreichii]MDK9343160.1 cadmium-translocating P-type ATPase [Propionibacterium freudenreichii]CEG91257.1 Heavy metal-(Cd/Co/Hg/Pb/Zn)-translocating P-type ATPase [Propionibacterium freudenreichii]